MTTITVKARLFAQFREIFGGEVFLSLAPGTMVAGAVRQLASRSADGKKAIFDENGGIREYVVLMRNGKRIETAEADTIPLADGDEIAVFPPVAGG
jgi:molybdopterin synthase sulfur carrier subunit